MPGQAGGHGIVHGQAVEQERTSVTRKQLRLHRREPLHSLKTQKPLPSAKRLCHGVRQPRDPMHMEFPAVPSEMGRYPRRKFLQAFKKEIAAMLR